ncbi:glycosyl hydrolase family 28 protein [Phocaeicola coprocola]|uniref:glycosyl hydrolase family 28 protein n=1 Tax=Phocaeicola coprocola TaxID=310298 RepID=UPI0026700FEA|nr:glycosyl hydrolase family 28 protein [Phocaeicola coprocola]
MKVTFSLIIILIPILHLWGYDTVIPDAYISKYFKVQYSIATHDSTALVFHSKSNHPSTIGFDVSWTNIPVDKNGTMVKIKSRGKIKDVVIKPSQQSINYKISDSILELKLDKPIKMVVEINGGSLHPLYIFGYKQKQYTIKHKNIVRFSPGFHKIGNRYPIKSNTAYILENGAYLKGDFYAKGTVENVIIAGQGVIDSGNQNWQHPLNGVLSNIQFEDGRYIELYDVTLVNAGNFQFKLQTKADGTRININGINMIAWNQNTDGIHISDMDWHDHAIIGNGKNTKLLVENCFIRANDDAILLCDGVSECVVRNCYFIDDGGGATFCLSWGAHQPVKRVDVRQCYIISKQKDNPIFRANHAGEAHIKNVYFKDIYIDGNVNCLVGLYIMPHRYDPDAGFGKISKIKFENIHLKGICKANYILGLDSLHTIDNIYFKNLFINGKHITKSEDGNFLINKYVNNVFFE